MDPGFRIAGRYELLECLGEGRIGRVFRARDHSPANGARPQSVVVKLPHTQHARQPEFAARFRREFAAGQRFIHPTLVRCLEVGEFSGLPFLVTEYIEGKLIDRWFQETDRGFERLAEVLLKLLEGLAAAHQNRLIHRELKPNNILVDNQDEPKLLDFGLAGRLEDQLRGPDSALSLSYLSPEQALGERGDERSDLYSLGAILYNLVSGRPMFSLDNAPGLLLCHINDEPTPLSRLRADVPLWLEKLVTRLVQKNPARRPASAQEVLAMVRRRRHAVPVQAVREEFRWVRERESELLGDALQGLKLHDRGSSLLLVGPLGCGLSALLRRARQSARELGLTTLDFGSSDGLLTTLPFIREPVLARRGDGDPSASPVEQILSRILGLAAECQGLVVFVDNCDQADEEAGQVLVGLAEAARHQPLVVLGACEEGYSPAWRPAFAQVVELKGWSREICSAYIEDRLWATPPSEMVQWFWKVSHGLPVSLRLLMERLEGRYFRVETGEMSWTSPPALETPENLPALLDNFLQAQGPELRDLLGVAACLGETFELNRLRAVSLEDDALLEHLLELATRGGWLDEIWEGGVAAYRFSHPCRHRAALAQVPARRQRRYHLLIGAFWERAQRQVSDWEKACYHYELAHEWELALRSLLKVLKACADAENWLECRHWIRRCRTWALELPPELRADQIFPAPWGNFGWSGRRESTACLHFLAAQLIRVGILDDARWYLQMAFEDSLEEDEHRWVENRLLMALALDGGPTSPEGQSLLDEALVAAREAGLEEHEALASALRFSSGSPRKAEPRAEFFGFRIPE